MSLRLRAAAYPILITLCTFVGTGKCQDIGFTESFSGSGIHRSVGGELTGFDNPGWKLEGTGHGSLTADGYQFHLPSNVSPLLHLNERVGRNLVGSGGYSSVLEFSDVVLDRGGGGAIVYQHWLNDDPSSIVHVLVIDSAGADTRAFSIFMHGGDSFGADVQKGVANFSLEFDFRFDEEAFQASYVTDDGTQAQLQVSTTGVSMAENSLVQLELDSQGNNIMSGTLEEWRLSGKGIGGDFNGDGVLGIRDIDLLVAAISTGELDFDLTGDGVVDGHDLSTWIHDLKSTYFGDANLDGEFASSDLVNSFVSGEYEDNIESNSSWATGDWNGDGEFTSSDIVVAFEDGGYEQGPRAAVVPEPNVLLLLSIGLLGSLSRGQSINRAS